MRRIFTSGKSAVHAASATASSRRSRHPESAPRRGSRERSFQLPATVAGAIRWFWGILIRGWQLQLCRTLIGAVEIEGDGIDEPPCVRRCVIAVGRQHGCPQDI